MDVKNTVGKRVKDARNEAGYSQEKLAELVGLSVTSISRLETGKQMVSLEKLIEIEEQLNIGIEAFLIDFVKTKNLFSDEKDCEILLLLRRCSPKQKDLIYESIKLLLKFSDDLAGSHTV